MQRRLVFGLFLFLSTSSYALTVNWKSIVLDMGRLEAGRIAVANLPWHINNPVASWTYRLNHGPSWMTVSTAGIILMKPKLRDQGLVSGLFEVSDGISVETVLFTGKVISNVNNSPPVWNQSVWGIGKLQAGQMFVQDVSGWVSDADGDPFVFAKKAGPAWMRVRSNGLISGVPTGLGNQIFVINVNDGKEDVGLIGIVEVVGSGVKTPTITVTPTPTQPVVPEPAKKPNQAPVFDEGVLNLGAIEVGQEVLVDVSSHATDPEKDPLTFTAQKLPLGVTLAKNGQLKIEPKPSQAEQGFEFLVGVSDGKLSASLKIQLSVKPLPKPKAAKTRRELW